LLFSDKARSASGNSAGSSSSGGNQTALHGAVALRKGDKGSEVKVMQIRLKELGYLAFTPDSVFGGGTEKAVIAFQKKNGLTSDGLAGKGTLSVLYGNNARPTESTTQMPETAKTTLRRGDNGGEVRNMQVRLRELGYITFSPDSAFGSGTRNAVIAFQKANHLTADGIAGASTLAKMYSSSAVAKSSGSGGSSSSVSAPNGSNVRLLHWFNVVKKNYRSGQVITVYDPNSRLSWKIRLMSMGRHADSEPLSAEDTATMNSAFGNKTTWNPKAVWIKFPDGVWSMATMHNTPHLSGTIQNNNFDGHLCIHFLRDMDECRQNDPKYGVQNQEALRSAWKALTGETVP
ncbi:MAG: peptidoglycan-binding protein, partial [Clostridia bacterium]